MKTSVNEFWEKGHFGFCCPIDGRTWSFLILWKIVSYKVKIIWERKTIKVQKFISVWWPGDISRCRFRSTPRILTPGFTKAMVSLPAAPRKQATAAKGLAFTSNSWPQPSKSSISIFQVYSGIRGRVWKRQLCVLPLSLWILFLPGFGSLCSLIWLP